MTTAAGHSGGATTSTTSRAQTALRLLSSTLLEDLDGLADRLTDMMSRSEPAYAELGRTAPDRLRRGVRDNLERGIQTLGDLVPPGVDPEDRARETGRTRAREGMPLETVLRAFRMGSQVIWEELLSLSRERFGGRYDADLLTVSGYAWRTTDASCAALVDDYRRQESRLRSEEIGQRQAFLNALLDGRGADEALAGKAATALGLPTCGPMLCVVAPVEVPTDEPLRSPRDTLATHGIVSSWYGRPTDIVGLIALGDRAPSTVLDALRPAVAGRVGCSPVITTLAQVREAHALAHTAANTVKTTPGMALLDDQLPEALIVDSPRLTSRLVRVAFGDLLALPEQERDTLLSTLEAVLAEGGSPTRAAQRLYCHRNTVIYRLRRVETLTGRSPSRPRDCLLFTLGLLALRHADPPDTGEHATASVSDGGLGRRPRPAE